MCKITYFPKSTNWFDWTISRSWGCPEVSHTFLRGCQNRMCLKQLVERNWWIFRPKFFRANREAVLHKTFTLCDVIPNQKEWRKKCFVNILSCFLSEQELGLLSSKQKVPLKKKTKKTNRKEWKTKKTHLYFLTLSLFH